MLGALAMVVVALISAFITMRFAIHGREAVVPALTGLSVTDATKAARRVGLNLALENRFYSNDTPAGRILAQDPAPGSRVRREWPIRITESLGAQRVNIPDLTGESERAATVSIRRLSLDLGSVAHLAVPGDPDVVLTQTPPVNSAGVDGPRVSLLVSDPDSAPTTSEPAYVMPSLTGLNFYTAAERAASAGLHIVLTPDNPTNPVPATPAATPAPASAAANTAPGPSQSPAATSAPATATPVPPSANSVVIAQTPQPGRRVARGDFVHVSLGHTSPAAGAASSQ
jgi:beta-lactam-binding protein with PASTA domain